jgi:mono/diheme cytochrome c family protein
MAGALAALALGACAQQDEVAQREEANLTSAQLVERGDYLVNSVVLCGDCHTPRDQNMAPIEARKLQGSPVPPMSPQDMFATTAPPIAGIPAHFTQDQFIAFLQTGVRPDGSHPRPPMPPYRLNDADARAVTAYIASLPRGEASDAAPAP